VPGDVGAGRLYGSNDLSRDDGLRACDNPDRRGGGRELVTLDDARTLMMSFPRRHESRLHLQHTVELLMRAAELGDRKSIDEAAAQISRALTVEGLL
jgi:hypothetical protein